MFLQTARYGHAGRCAPQLQGQGEEKRKHAVHLEDPALLFAALFIAKMSFSAATAT